MDKENFIRVDWEKFRHDLAFPTSGEKLDEKSLDEAFNFLVALCAILPRFYGQDLEREKLWVRIESGLAVASSRCSRSDEIADCMLSHICAEVNRAAADEDLLFFMKRSKSIGIQALKHIIQTRRLLVVCNAREKWLAEG